MRREPLDSGLVTRRWGNPAKATAMLGFAATTSVEEGMRQVIAWREAGRACRAKSA